MEANRRYHLRHITGNLWISPQHSGKLKPVLVVLDQFATLHDEYIEQELYVQDGNLIRGDIALWYRERPQVGLFAAAVWKSGGIALEEYGTTKLEAGAARRGRGDLFIKIAGTGYLCEAKHTWISAADMNEACQRFAAACSAAESNAATATDSWPKLALTFGSFETKSVAAAKVADLVDHFANDFQTKYEGMCHALQVIHPLQTGSADPIDSCRYGLALNIQFL